MPNFFFASDVTYVCLSLFCHIVVIKILFFILDHKLICLSQFNFEIKYYCYFSIIEIIKFK